MYNNLPEKYIASVFTFGHGTGTVTFNTTRYLAGFDSASATAATGDVFKVVIPRPGILKNLSMKALATSTINGTGHSVEVLINGVSAISPPLIVTWDSPPPGITPNAQPNPNEVSVNTGDVVSVRLITKGTSGTLARPTVSFELEVYVDANYVNRWNFDSAASRLTYMGGRVGIGTATPIEQLDVNGIVNMTRIKLPGGNPGEVITQDPAGYGRWMPPPSPGDIGNQNTAVGFESLLNNTTGASNTANGYKALTVNTVGNDNTAIGTRTLLNNQTGGTNTALGAQALLSNTLGSANTAVGYNSLFSNVGGLASGYHNTAVGHQSLNLNTMGYFNTALGSSAGPMSNNLVNTTAIGANAQVSTSNSLVLGGTGTNAVNVGIGTTSPVVPLQIKPGVVYLDGTPGARVYFNNSGPEWCIGTENGAGGGIFSIYNYRLNRLTLTVNPNDNGVGFDGIVYAPCYFYTSSKRWKKNIQPIKDALSTVKRLRGVSYDQKENDKHTIGLVAEEVGEVLPEIVSYEENGKDAKGLDYSRLVALLIEAVKEQQVQIEELKAKVKSS